jgi:hypothetical protein
MKRMKTRLLTLSMALVLTGFAASSQALVVTPECRNCEQELVRCAEFCHCQCLNTCCAVCNLDPEVCSGS